MGGLFYAGSIPDPQAAPRRAALCRCGKRRNLCRSQSRACGGQRRRDTAPTSDLLRRARPEGLLHLLRRGMG